MVRCQATQRALDWHCSQQLLADAPRLMPPHSEPSTADPPSPLAATIWHEAARTHMTLSGKPCFLSWLNFLRIPCNRSTGYSFYCIRPVYPTAWCAAMPMSTAHSQHILCGEHRHWSRLCSEAHLWL